MMALIEIIPVVSSQSSDPMAATRRADELASRALAIDPNDDFAHVAKAWVLMAQNRHEDAIVEAESSLALNPSFITAYLVLGTVNNFLGRPDRAIEFADKAIRLSPRDPLLPAFYHDKGWAFFMKQQYEPAIEWLRRAGASPFTYLLLASALALIGHSAEAKKVLDQYKAYPGVNTTTIAQLRMQQFALADNPEWIAYNERLFDGLRKAGMPEN